MKLQLDTNALIWSTFEPGHLSSTPRSQILEPTHQRFVSLASLWEMQVKHSLGRLPLSGEVQDEHRGWLEKLEAELLPIEVRQVGMPYKLAVHHKGPFDRMLQAQALSEGMTIVSP